MKVSDYIIDFIASLGVKNIFCVTGGGAMHMNNSLGSSEKVKGVFMLHEQGASIAAERYPRINEGYGDFLPARHVVRVEEHTVRHRLGLRVAPRTHVAEDCPVDELVVLLREPFLVGEVSGVFRTEFRVVAHGVYAGAVSVFLDVVGDGTDDEKVRRMTVNGLGDQFRPD